MKSCRTADGKASLGLDGSLEWQQRESILNRNSPICLLTESDEDFRLYNFYGRLQKSSTAVCEPVCLNLRLHPGRFQTENRIREEQWAASGVNWRRLLYMDVDAREQTAQHFVRGIVAPFMPVIAPAVSNITPVLTDDHQSRIEVALPQRPWADVSGVEPSAVKLRDVRQSSACAAPFALPYETAVAGVLVILHSRLCHKSLLCG
jgi:hypothetical protein